LPDGLVLVAGPTGSGKSTTLATLLNRINQTRRCHLVTIEDPIEYLHTSALALVNQRQVGSDTEHFHEAVVAAMRQDPDVILVGEIRDLATIRAAVTAAETGHLVFTTVHASDCVGAIERLIAVFPAEEQGGVRRQVSMVCGRSSPSICWWPTAPRTGSRAGSRGRRCGRRRARSRVVTSEILVSTPAVANLIATEKSAQIYSAMESGTALGDADPGTGSGPLDAGRRAVRGHGDGHGAQPQRAARTRRADAARRPAAARNGGRF
jgi:twitching motility protein PilT